MNFREQIARAADVLRRGATGKPKEQATPAPVADAPAAPAKPYFILARGDNGNYVSKPASREEWLDYCNNSSAWRRIG